MMTRRLFHTARSLCDGRLVMVHEGGYSEVYVPFCGHAVLEELSGSAITAHDPLADTLNQRQPGPRCSRAPFWRNQDRAPAWPGKASATSAQKAGEWSGRRRWQAS